MKHTYDKLTALLLIFVLLFSLSSCAGKKEEDGGEQPPEEEVWVWDGPKYDDLYQQLGKADVDLSAADGVLAKVLKSGVLVIGTSPDYPPAEGVDEATGEVKGSEMLLAQYIANSLGVELKIETMDFNAVLVAVQTGKVDLGVSGFGYKADRAESYELSIGYQSGTAAAHHTLAVLTQNLGKYSSLADFNKAGLKIDAQAGSLQEMYVTDQLPNADLQLVTSLDTAILDLLSGKVDAIALDSTTARNYAETSSGKLVSVYEEKEIEFDLSIYTDVEGNVIAAKKGETSLINAVNQVIQQLIAIENAYGTEYNAYSVMYYAACDYFGVVPGEDE